MEHQHFNDPEKREHIRKLFLRAKEQGAIPIVNYNDPVSDEENRKWELSNLRREHREVHECVDNDETAAVIAGLVTARTLLIMTSTEGIYADPKDPKTLIRDVEARTPEEMERKIRELQTYCMGASRAGANGAHAKLEYALGPAMRGTTVIIGHGRPPHQRPAGGARRLHENRAGVTARACSIKHRGFERALLRRGEEKRKIIHEGELPYAYGALRPRDGHGRGLCAGGD